MPLIDVKIFSGRLTPQTQQQLIAGLTDAVVAVFGEPIRDQTWVVLEGVDPARWGIGGRPGAADPPPDPAAWRADLAAAEEFLGPDELTDPFDRDGR